MNLRKDERASIQSRMSLRVGLDRPGESLMTPSPERRPHRIEDLEGRGQMSGKHHLKEFFHISLRAGRTGGTDAQFRCNASSRPPSQVQHPTSERGLKAELSDFPTSRCGRLLQPIFESFRSDASARTCHETFVVELRAKVASMRISDYFSRVAARIENTAN